MGMSTMKLDDAIFGRVYNVEYELGSGKVMTFSNKLQNADGKHFWFSSEESGMDCIRQDRVITMSCCDRHMRKSSMFLHDENIKAMEDCVNFHAISEDGLMKIVKLCTAMNDRGIYPDAICDWLKGICHNDMSDSGIRTIDVLDKQNRLKLSNDVIDVAKFWNRVLQRELEYCKQEQTNL